MYRCFFLILFVFCLSSCTSNNATIDTKEYEAQKQSLANKEKTAPLAFLQVKSESRKNWIGQTVVEGTIINTAAVSSYKNVRLKMLCYNTENTIIEEHEDVLDAIIKPNNNKEFKLRYRLPRNADSVAVNIMSAAIVK